MEFNNLCMGCMKDKGNNDICPSCGWKENTQPEAPQHLSPRTVLNGRYLIGKVLGHGGFGITYLAWDMDLNTKLAIKEYLPHDFATRNSGQSTVSVYSGDMKEQFDYGMEKFLEEARALAQFDNNPTVVSVRQFFRENGTAYIVMNYLEGITFKEYIEQRGSRIPYDEALNYIMPVIDALQEVHGAGMLHRDISPDNIYITKNKQVKLLDFGAARYAISGYSKSISVILKHGYAPEEQYRTKGKQGPWTDIYAVAATMYRAITGQVPPESLDRLEEDTLKLPSELGVDIPKQAEKVLMKALSVRAADRYASMAEFQNALIADVVDIPDCTTALPQNSAGGTAAIGNVAISGDSAADNSIVGTKEKNTEPNTYASVNAVQQDSNNEEPLGQHIVQEKYGNLKFYFKSIPSLKWVVGAAGAIALVLVVLITVLSVKNRNDLTVNSKGGVDGYNVAGTVGNKVPSTGESSTGRSSTKGQVTAAGKNDGTGNAANETGLAIASIPSMQNGKIKAPDITNITEASARQILASVGLSVGNVQYADDPNIAFGNVISQSIAAGTVVNDKTTIDIIVSGGQSGENAVAVADSEAFGLTGGEAPPPAAEEVQQAEQLDEATLNSLIHQANAYFNEGVDNHEAGNFNEAVKKYNEAVAIYTRIVLYYNDFEVKRFLGHCYTNIAVIALNSGNAQQALDNCMKADTIYKELLKDYKELLKGKDIAVTAMAKADAVFDAAFNSFFISESKMDLKDFSGAAQAARQSLQFYSELYEAGRNYIDDASLGDAYGYVSYTEMYNGNPEGVINAALKGISLNPDAKWMYLNLAIGYMLNNQYIKAIEIFDTYKNYVIQGSVTIRFDTLKTLDNPVFADAALETLKALKACGITHPDMNKVERFLYGE